MKSISRRGLLFGSLGAVGASMLSADAPAAVPTNKHLVFVFLRGGVDGLGLVTPLGATAAGLAASVENHKRCLPSWAGECPSAFNSRQAIASSSETVSVSLPG
jgi:hypothetical protein